MQDCRKMMADTCCNTLFALVFLTNKLVNSSSAMTLTESRIARRPWNQGGRWSKKPPRHGVGGAGMAFVSVLATNLVSSYHQGKET